MRLKFPEELEMSEMNSTGGKGSARRPGEITQSAWEAVFGKRSKPVVTPCGGCGESDPDKRCFGCRHPFTPQK